MRGIYIRDPAFLKPELPARTRNVHDSSVYESMRYPGESTCKCQFVLTNTTRSRQRNDELSKLR